MQQKVTVFEITHIMPGERKVFELPTGKAMYAAKNTAYVQPKQNPRADVERYKCEELGTTEEGHYLLAITAIPKEGVSNDNTGSGSDS